MDMDGSKLYISWNNKVYLDTNVKLKLSLTVIYTYM